MIALKDFAALKLVTPGHIWSHWSLLRSRTSTKMTMMVIMALGPLNKELFGRVGRRRRNASLIDLLASPQVKTPTANFQ